MHTRKLPVNSYTIKDNLLKITLFFIVSCFITNSNAASLDELVIDSDPNSCKANIERTAKDLDVSGEVLKAIAQVESDYNPYAVNFEGKSFIFDNRSDALKFVKGKLAMGKKSIDVGCMQINLKYHPTAFEHLEDAFVADKNVAYGAKYLKKLYMQEHNYGKAIALYHASEKQYQKNYLCRIKAVLSGTTCEKDTTPTQQVKTASTQQKLIQPEKQAMLLDTPYGKLPVWSNN